MNVPQDLDAERAVLGGLMLGGTADGLTSGDFYRPAHQLVFEAIEALRAEGKAETIAVADELRRRGRSARRAALSTCTPSSPGANGREDRLLCGDRPRARRAAEAGRGRRPDAPGHAKSRGARSPTSAPWPPGWQTARPRAQARARKVVSLADVEAERVDWLWHGYLPLGKVVVLDGDPGVGKSTVSLDIAARTSTGSPMPDGSAGVKGTVLVLSAEDGLADTIRPRLDAAQRRPGPRHHHHRDDVADGHG